MKRLTPALLTMIMFGVVGLLIAAYVAKNLLAVEDKKPAPASRNVPMAVAEIPVGTVITENHLGQGPYPIDKLDRDTLLVNRVVVGRVAKETIKAAQPIRAHQLYQPGELPPLDVPAGMRAVSLEVAGGVNMVDGMIKPGQFVDVLFTYGGTSDANTQGGVTLRLFEGVRIIAINRNFTQSPVDRAGNRVTLELTEPQTNVVVLAQSRGVITLTYNPNGRGNGGLALSNTERVTLNEILGLRPAEPPIDPFTTEAYTRGSRTVLQFNDKGRRIDGYNPLPNSNNRQMVLPNQPPGPGSDAPAASPSAPPPAPSVDRAVPGPQDVPATRAAPTAARLTPIQN